MNKRGFTLVELSIVLVIVGLLIGGILVAKSMTNAARLQSFVRELQQYDIMAQNFKTKYGDIPGDSTAMGCTVRFTNTCGDKIIHSHASMLGGSMGYRTEEIFGFWKSLSRSGTLSSTYSGYNGFTSFSGDFTNYSPKIGYGSGCFINALTLNTAMGSSIDFGNAWIIAGSDVSNPQFGWCLSSPDAHAVDSKLDNSLPASGSVIVTGYSNVDTGGYNGGCLANEAGAPYDIKGRWYVANTNQQETTPNPERIGCGLIIKANWD